MDIKRALLVKSLRELLKLTDCYSNKYDEQMSNRNRWKLSLNVLYIKDTSEKLVFYSDITI